LGGFNIHYRITITKTVFNDTLRPYLVIRVFWSLTGSIYQADANVEIIQNLTDAPGTRFSSTIDSVTAASIPIR
jgi:hypothetical protein